MVLIFDYDVRQALKDIQIVEQKEFVISEQQRESMIEVYGKAKWAVVDMLNERYSAQQETPFDLHHWLSGNEEDEVAYFLNEAGSNALNYAEAGAPAAFHLWLGKKGFVIGIEQQGAGFDAGRVHQLRIAQHQGGGFDFFRKCQGIVFFDKKEKAKVIYFLGRIQKHDRSFQADRSIRDYADLHWDRHQKEKDTGCLLYSGICLAFLAGRE